MGRIAHLLTDTISISSPSGIDNYGESTWGATTTAAARVENINEVIVGTDQNEYQATHVIATETAISYEDRIWLPTDNTSNADEARRPIKIVNAFFPGETDGHYEVYL